MGRVIPRGNQARMKEQIESLTRWGRLSPLWRNERLLSVRVTISSLCARGWQERVATASPLLKTFSTRLVQTVSHVLALFSTEGLNHRKMLYLKTQKFLVYIIIQHNKLFNKIIHGKKYNLNKSKLDARSKFEKIPYLC